MKKFFVIYHAPMAAMKQTENTSPEDMKKSMEAWMVWAKECGESLVDLGSPLGNGEKVNQSGSTQSDKDVVGYSILQANNMKEAKEMLQGHPHLGWNSACDIEIHEVLPLPK